MDKTIKFAAPKNPFEEYPFFNDGKKLNNENVLLNIDNLSKEERDVLLKKVETWAEHKKYKTAPPKKINPFASKSNFVVNKQGNQPEINKDYNDYQNYLLFMKIDPESPPVKSRMTPFVSEAPIVTDVGQSVETRNSILYILSIMGKGSHGNVYKAIKINKKKEDGNNKTKEEIESEKESIIIGNDDTQYCIIKIPKYANLNVFEQRYYDREDSVLRYLNEDPNQKFIVKYIGREKTIDNTFYISFYGYTPGYVSLEEYFKNNMNKTKDFYANVFYKIFLCIKHIHTYGIVHGDLKPDNIMISENANVDDVNILFLIDFGSSCKLHEEAVEISPEFNNILCGSEYLGYSPTYSDLRILKCLKEEKNKNKCYINKNIIPGIDYFSLGIIMYSTFYQLDKRDYSTAIQIRSPFVVIDPVINNILGYTIPKTVTELINYYTLYSDESFEKINSSIKTQNIENQEKNIEKNNLFNQRIKTWKDKLQRYFTGINHIMLEYYKEHEIKEKENQIPKMEELFRMYQIEKKGGNQSHRNRKKTKPNRKKTKNIRKK